MTCLWCGAETRIIDTDKLPRTTVRIRKCTGCGLAETTDEIPRENSLKLPKPDGIVK
mgnify:CR=1 FL=1